VRIRSSLRLDADPLAARAEVRFEQVNLQRALIELELGDRTLGVLDGTLAVLLTPTPATADPDLEPVAILRRLQLEHGLVTYREPAQDTEMTLAFAAGPGVSRPLVQGEGRFRGAPVAVSLSTSPPLNAIVAGSPLRAEGQVRIGNTVRRVEARLADAGDLSRLQAGFDLTGDFRELAALTGSRRPDPAPRRSRTCLGCPCRGRPPTESRRPSSAKAGRSSSRT
jgi:hypothetical protein